VRLYLVQHGQATREEEDPDRPLTDQGAVDVRFTAHHVVSELGASPPRILHSGKTRARQTAAIWAEVLGDRTEAVDALAPNDDPAVWAERVAALDEDLMLVGHLPHLGRLAALLVRGDPDQPVVAFRPGTVVVLERGDTGWSVAAAVPPEDSLRH
jgi:phosphohistidine phosphatase